MLRIQSAIALQKVGNVLKVIIMLQKVRITQTKVRYATKDDFAAKKIANLLIIKDYIIG